jgi:hypothetical protein
MLFLYQYGIIMQVRQDRVLADITEYFHTERTVSATLVFLHEKARTIFLKIETFSAISKNKPVSIFLESSYISNTTFGFESETHGNPYAGAASCRDRRLSDHLISRRQAAPT